MNSGLNATKVPWGASRAKPKTKQGCGSILGDLSNFFIYAEALLRKGKRQVLRLIKR
jgi:hypothetical protein